jgi:hypothetical protein
MNPQICDHEMLVLAALADGSEIDTELAAHLANCEACSEAATVFSYMRQLARYSEPTALPSADAILWRAQIAERQRLAQRSVAVIEFWWKAAAAAALLIAIFALAVWGPGNVVLGEVVGAALFACAAIFFTKGSVHPSASNQGD